MNDLKIGDRVKVSIPHLGKTGNKKIRNGMAGTVKELTDNFVGVEFDNYMGGHNGSWGGKEGYCWYVFYECLEKIEEADTETKEEVEEMDTKAKAETLEQKILEVLREEIGVDIGEEFDVYKKGVKQWTCKFKGGEFCQKVNYELCKSDVWIDLIWNFSSYTFKRKPFVLKYEEDYFFLSGNYDGNKDMNFRVIEDTWINSIIDYGRLALGNVFRSEEEALASKDKLLEKLEKLRRGEV